MCDVRRGELVGPKCDVWALGVSLFKMTRLRDLFGVAGEERLAILNFEPHAKLPRPSADAAVYAALGPDPWTTSRSGQPDAALPRPNMHLTRVRTPRRGTKQSGDGDPLEAMLNELTRLCLTKEVARRPSAAELLQVMLPPP